MTSVDLDDDVAVAELPEYDRDILLELWKAHSAAFSTPHAAQSTFPDLVARSFLDGDSLEIIWCESCVEPGSFGEDEMTGVKGGEYACESCLEDDYFYCESCDEYDTTFDASYVNGNYVCEDCEDRYYSYCDECDESYHNDYSEDHDHAEDCDCEAPPESQAFTMRNDGEDPLAQDTRATISLPAGEIDEQGIQRIVEYLLSAKRSSAAVIVSRGIIGIAWQTREGNYTKRLSRANHKDGGEALTPEMMSQIGVIARDHSKPVDHQIKVTRDLNLSASDFYHGESCWWSSHSESRCALKSNGGIGLRTFGDRGHVTGRAWIMPLKVKDGAGLTPTTETLDPDAFVVFNGYGDLSGYTAARIVAHMAGMTYRKISFDVDPMYVNSNAGYLVAPEAIAAPYTNGSLYLTLDQHANLYETEQKEAQDVA